MNQPAIINFSWTKPVMIGCDLTIYGFVKDTKVFIITRRRYGQIWKVRGYLPLNYCTQDRFNSSSDAKAYAEQMLNQFVKDILS